MPGGGMEQYMKKKLAELNIKLDSLTIFRQLLADPVIAGFQNLIYYMGEKDVQLQVDAYCEFTSSLYQKTPNLSAYINHLIYNDENFYVKEKAAGKQVSYVVEAALEAELATLQQLADLTSASIKEAIDYKGFLPDWENAYLDLRADYKDRIEKLPVTGYGMYSKFTTFHLVDGQIAPVHHPDPQSLSQLFGYERERGLIMKNTEALVNGEGASNMLLYGDAGTGKSSTIKAVCNHFADQGLRLLEIKKNELYQIPYVVEELSANPLKFVIFIDDLSFTANDDNFSALKAILEGSVTTCGNNIAIFATSNRRHLVKENMGDRSGDELHINDTLQETMSLAARFGLTITFQRPEKDQYLDIVKNLAAEYGIEMDEEELFKKAEAHAIRRSGRSPRVAKQFIELLKVGL